MAVSRADTVDDGRFMVRGLASSYKSALLARADARPDHGKSRGVFQDQRCDGLDGTNMESGELAGWRSGIRGGSIPEGKYLIGTRMYTRNV